MNEAHCNNLPQRKALGLVTHDNTGGPFVVECQGCGEVYPSFHCLGGEQIADTGDHEDARCPHCDQVDPHECDNAALAWNTQQLKINELQQRLNAADQLNDELKRDADRYRWLRDPDTRDGLEPEDLIVVGIAEGEDIVWLEQMDQAIDANLDSALPNHTGDATEKVAQPFTEQFLEDHLGKMPAAQRDES